MAAIQAWNRQNVHHSQDDADEGGKQPELLPIPSRGENIANGDERAYTLGTLGTGYVLEVVNIPAKRAPSLLQTGRNTRE